MKKMRRSERIVDLTQQFLHKPNIQVSLTNFAGQFLSAKSSISEDIDIINRIFQEKGIGELVTIAGAGGGVKYIPSISIEEARDSMEEICQSLSNSERLLPGGYLYMLDIIGNPFKLKQIGRIFATYFAKMKIDGIITVETKGIPIAYATAFYLNVPVYVIRKDNKVTEGSVVTINYVSGSTKRIQTMSLAKRSLKENSNVAIIDDFMKAGGTMKGTINLLQEFNTNIKGIGVLVEVDGIKERLVTEYISLARLISIDEKVKKVNVVLGNYFKEEF